MAERYYDQLLKVARGWLGSSDLAQDAVQEAYLGYYQWLEGGYVPHNCFAMLLTLTRNKAVDLLRSEGKHQHGELTGDEVAPAMALDPALSSALFRTITLDMTTHEARVANATLAEGLTQEEIAIELGESQSTVSRLLARAMNKLQETINAEA